MLLFDEIQEARDRLTDQHSGERQVVESIEAAYDAILMGSPQDASRREN
jgi:hypothetical protein